MVRDTSSREAGRSGMNVDAITRMAPVDFG